VKCCGWGGKGGCTLFAPLRKGDCPLCHAGKGDSPRFQEAGNGCSPLFLGLLVLALLTASPLYAQSVEVTASLAVTDGYARPGSYVPVTLKATNNGHETVTELRLSSGSPVDIVTPWKLAPGESGEKTVPAFYVGGELRLALEFRSAASKVIAQAEPAALSPRAAPQGAAPDLKPFPAGADERVQPDAYRLLSMQPWSAQERSDLWGWLAIFSLAALVVGVMLLRRRVIVPAVALILLAVAATAFLSFFGELREARVEEARVFYVGGGRPQAAMEHFAVLASRGGATAKLALGKGGQPPLPLPILASSEDLFQPLATLHLGDEAWIESRGRQAIFHILDRAQPPVALGDIEKGAQPDLAAIAKRADVVAALYVDGDRASAAAGKSQALDAWAVEWKSAADADLAYAGRSLAWWDRARREGDGAALLVWCRDPLPPGEAQSENRTRLPAMAVYTTE